MPIIRHVRYLVRKPYPVSPSEPGLRVLHVQEADYETTCYTFVSCLQEIKT